MSATTRELASETWAEYFDALSRELLHAPTTIEVIEPSGPANVEARHLALHALTYDRRDDVFEVAVDRGGPHLPASFATSSITRLGWRWTTTRCWHR